MDDVSGWETLREWVADPAHRTFVWSGISCIVAFMLGIIGMAVGPPRRAYGGSAPGGEEGNPWVEVVLGLLILLTIGGMVAVLRMPRVQAALAAVSAVVRSCVDAIAHWFAGPLGQAPPAWVTLASAAVLVAAFVLVVALTRFVWKCRVWWRVVGAVLVALVLWAWLAPGQVGSVWAFAMAHGLSGAVTFVREWLTVPDRQGRLFAATGLLAIAVAHAVWMWKLSTTKDTDEHIFGRSRTWRDVWKRFWTPWVGYMIFLPLSLLAMIGILWVGAIIGRGGQ
jgi:hypothetical protein